MQNAIVFGLMLVWFLFFVAGEYCSKVWSEQPSIALTLVVLAAYSVGVLAWLQALLLHGKLSVLSTVFSALAMVAAAGLGIFVFDEVLRPIQLLGICLAIIGCILAY